MDKCNEWSYWCEWIILPSFTQLPQGRLPDRQDHNTIYESNTMTYLDQWWKQKCFWSPPPNNNNKKQARQIHFGLGRLELHSYWYWFGICWCPGFGLVSSEIPLVVPLRLEDVHRELENDIITLFQASLQNLFPSALSPHQEGQHFPEAPKQTPLYVIDQNWATWALLAETKTEKASIWPVYWDASQGEGVLRGQSVASGLLLCKAPLVVTQREKQVFIPQYYLNRLPIIKILQTKRFSNRTSVVSAASANPVDIRQLGP